MTIHYFLYPVLENASEMDNGMTLFLPELFIHVREKAAIK